MEEGALVGPVLLGGTQQGVLVREDGAVLSDDVKQMHPTRLNRLCDVVVGCNQSMANGEAVNQSASSTCPISSNQHLPPVTFQPINIYHM